MLSNFTTVAVHATDVSQAQETFTSYSKTIAYLTLLRFLNNYASAITLETTVKKGCAQAQPFVYRSSKSTCDLKLSNKSNNHLQLPQS